MPEYNAQLDDQVLADGSVPIAGVNNAQPPSTIDQTLAEDAMNRLAEPDSVNRPRPGLRQRIKTPVSFDSIHHVGTGKFLWNDASSWFLYDSRAVANNAVTGGPAWAHGDQIYSALCDQVLYFSRGGPLYKYTPASNTFAAVTTPAPFATICKYPTWAFARLIVAMANNLYVSNILSPEVWNPVLQSVTLDPVASDEITGMVIWQRQTLAVFRNGSTWIIETGPNLDVVNWEINRASATVGCCSHGTIVQCGVDVFFLSETGRGVYALSQVPTSDQMGVWQPISQPIKRYIDRINWAQADQARATYWKDLYILSVPIDDSTFNNAIFAYSVTLNAWQGVWTFDFDGDGVGYGFRDSARDRTNVAETLLLYGTIDGFISEQTYPTDRQYWDLKTDSVTRLPIKSSLRSRSFTFSESNNQIQPHTAKIQFLESNDPVDVTVISDRTIKLRKVNTPTGQQGLSLPIPGFTFNLVEQGYYNLPMSLSNVGICSEIQLQLEGTGNWSLYQLKLTAFEAEPLTVR
jgi:hypothetical protein